MRLVVTMVEVVSNQLAVAVLSIYVLLAWNQIMLRLDGLPNDDEWQSAFYERRPMTDRAACCSKTRLRSCTLKPRWLTVNKKLAYSFLPITFPLTIIAYLQSLQSCWIVLKSLFPYVFREIDQERAEKCILPLIESFKEIRKESCLNNVENLKNLGK